MIRKLRWKFVGIMMTIITIFLVLILTTLYYSAQLNYRSQSMDTLHSAIKEVKEASSGNPPPPAPRSGPPLPAREASPHSGGGCKNRRLHFHCKKQDLQCGQQ